MCTIDCLTFGASRLHPREVEGKRVLEVGAYDVNGSLRPIVTSWKPSEYIGVDLSAGPGVDIVCHAENLVERFGPESFDVVLATEILEHARNWREVVSNLKRVCKRGGILLVTTVKRGFPYHAYPHDFWRYEMEDMREIFSDCGIEALESGRNPQAILVRIRKPADFREKDLTSICLYSIVTNRRMASITEGDFRNTYYFRQIFKVRLQRMIDRFSRWAWEVFRMVFKV